jgi:hypothetical protein
MGVDIDGKEIYNLVRNRNFMIDDILKNRLNIYLEKILNLTSPLIEVYTLARMFKTVSGLYNPEPKYIVVFQGNAHTRNLSLFLRYNHFKRIFESSSGIHRMLNISKLPQPIFE